jgi:diadenosine tetraphosphate (Ap4A) HIT family hydrolase
MVGAVIDGYLLIVHKNHYHSMAEMPSKDIQSLRKLIDIIKSELSKSYGPSIVFEHGSTCDNISCLVDHAHLHIVPVPNGFDMKKDIEQDFELFPMQKYLDLQYWRHGGLGRLHYQINDGKIDETRARKRYVSFSGYLYYENAAGDMFIHELVDLFKFQPQYLRMVLLKKLGKEIWEWHENIDQECQRRTIEKLDGLLKYLKPIEIRGR